MSGYSSFCLELRPLQTRHSEPSSGDMWWGGVESLIKVPLSDTGRVYARLIYRTLALAVLMIFNQPLIGQTFHPVATTITPVINAEAAWADMNNDGWPDLLVSGTDQPGNASLIYYESNGDSTFNRMEIAQLAQVVFDLADYNHDGYIDLLVSGKTPSDEKVVRVYRNNNGLSFTDMEWDLANLTQGDVLWADLDGDAQPEILVSGLNDGGEEVLALYRLEGGEYVSLAHGIEPLAYGNLIAFDANKDGQTELSQTGYDVLGNPTTRIYTFDWELTAHLYFDGNDGFTLSDTDQADINGDGYTDLVITGVTDDLMKATYVYLNNQFNGFTRSGMELDQVSSASLDLGDLNNDGFTDLVLMGLDNDDDALTQYYAHSGVGSTLVPAAHVLESLYGGSIALGDFNRDGSLDVFQTGQQVGGLDAGLFASDISLSTMNEPPMTPGGLTSMVNDGQVILDWSAASDDLTPGNSLTYNVYVSASEGGVDLVLSPLSDLSDGYRRLPKGGNAGHSTKMLINKLAEGRYYWNVQAIDNAFVGSAFAAEEEFVVCDPLFLGADSAVCYGEVIRLEAGEAGDEVNWYSEVQDKIVASGVLFYNHLVIEKDTLVAEVTRQDLGCVLYDTIIIDVKGPIELDLGPDFSMCWGDSTELVLTGFESVNWYTEDGLVRADQSFIGFLQTDKDTVVAEVFFQGGCIQYDTLIVDLYPPVDFSLGSDTALCMGDTLPLLLEGFETVHWYLESVGLVKGDTESFLYPVAEDDRVIAEGIDEKGCLGFDTLMVHALPLPEVDLGMDTALCYGAMIELLTEGFEEVNWYSLISGWLSEGDHLLFEALASDTLVVEVLNASGCQVYDTLAFEVLSLPAVDMGLDVVVCAGETVLLQQQDPFIDRVDWFTVSGMLLQADQWFYTWEADETDTLVAQVTNLNGCIGLDTLIVKVDPLPVFELQDTMVCYGDELLLEVVGDWEEVNWYTTGNQVLAANQAEYAFVASTSMTIWAEAIQDGCAGNDTLQVTVNPLPVFDLGVARSYCLGDQITLEVEEMEVVYAWKNSSLALLSSQPILNVEATVSEQYFLQVVDDKGCTYEDSVLVSVHALPEVNITGETEVCMLTPLNLNVEISDFEAIRWYDGLAETLGESKNLVYSPTESGAIHVWLEDANHCVGRDTVPIVVHPLPQADAGEDQLICFGSETSIGGGYEDITDLVFEWQTHEALSSMDIPNPNATPVGSTWFILEVTDGNDCMASDSVHIVVNPQITVDAGQDQVYCFGEKIGIGGNPSASGSLLDYVYRWTPSTGLSSPSVPNPVVSAEEDQTYVLAVTSGDCETLPDTVKVVVRAPPEVVVSPTQSVGSGESVRLYASGGGYYHWEPGELLDNTEVAEPLATPFKSAEFIVEVMDELGCITMDTVTVLVQNNLFIPNLFTPNGDGNNDYFKVYGSGINEIFFSVYDLNGNQVFVGSGVEAAVDQGWDGTFRGESLPNGVYIWTIEGMFFDGRPLKFDEHERGTVKLLR